MKKIGFIDYYISEWHANNYPAFIKRACDVLGVEYKVCYAWAELDRSPLDQKTTDEWCERFGAEKCATIEELCEKSDVIMILAPSNHEKHLAYAEKAFTAGKPTYIDKTFTADYPSALRIVELSEKYSTPFFSASALRYSPELDKTPTCDSVDVTGGGPDIEEYIVHQLDMVTKKIGAGAISVTAYPDGEGTVYKIGYPDSRRASMRFEEGDRPFTVSNPDGKGGLYSAEIRSDYFHFLTLAILRFFEEGRAPFEISHMLDAMKIRDAVLMLAKSKEYGKTVVLPE